MSAMQDQIDMFEAKCTSIDLERFGPSRNLECALLDQRGDVVTLDREDIVGILATVDSLRDHAGEALTDALSTIEDLRAECRDLEYRLTKTQDAYTKLDKLVRDYTRDAKIGDK